jgi:23S rRNA (adenine2030-N6)-methyltransferase
MNYRHVFHAGNFADVFKHGILIGLLDALKAKPAPFCYVDTHAGRGLYDLHDEQAQKTGEYLDGVQRIVDASGLPDALGTYVDLVRSFNTGTRALERYPGSPMIASRLLRECDRAILCEVQEDEVTALKANLRGDRRFAIHHRDGYAALKALLPPAQKRGLVLIDPPFEAQAIEYVHIGNALADAFALWPSAIYAIWYPIKLRENVIPFQRWLRDHCGTSDVLAAEILLRPDNSPLRLNGCGMAIVNPPWRFERNLDDWLPRLADRLGSGARAQYRVEWLTRD